MKQSELYMKSVVVRCMQIDRPEHFKSSLPYGDAHADACPCDIYTSTVYTHSNLRHAKVQTNESYRMGDHADHQAWLMG